MGTEKVRERFREERKRLGVPEGGLTFIGQEGSLVTEDKLGEEIKAFDEELDKADRIAEREEHAQAITDGSESDEKHPSEEPLSLAEPSEEDIQEKTLQEKPEDKADAEFMVEEEQPKVREKKGLFRRLLGR